MPLNSSSRWCSTLLAVLALATLFGSTAGQAVPTDLPESKAERTALARQLVNRLEGLTFRERRTLERLEAEGFAELLRLNMLRLEQYRTMSRRVRNPLTDVDAATAYWRFHYSLCFLSYQVPRDTEAILRLFQQAGTDRRMVTLRRDVLEVLVEREDQRVVTLCLKELADPRSPFRDLALRRVLQSHDPRAEAWQAQPSNLVAEEEASSVGTPDMRRTLPPLTVLMGLDWLSPRPVRDDDTDFPLHLAGTKLLALEADRDGTRWGWISSKVLGDSTDRWIARYFGQRWTDMSYAGQFEDPVPDWRVRFARDRSLRRDTDGDGWSDLVEQRVGTDPRRVDTDNDGLKDSMDRNPLAAPRPLNDLERLLTAAGEACASSGSGYPSGIFFPDGTAALEVPWCGGITIARPFDEKRTTLEFQDGDYVSDVSFFGPSRDFRGNTTGRQTGKLALWNDARTEAKIGVGVSISPMAGTTFDVRLKRVGSRWIVTEVQRIRTA